MAGCHWVCVDCGEELWYDGWRMEVSMAGSFVRRPPMHGGAEVWTPQMVPIHAPVQEASPLVRESHEYRENDYAYELVGCDPPAGMY